MSTFKGYITKITGKNITIDVGTTLPKLITLPVSKPTVTDEAVRLMYENTQVHLTVNQGRILIIEKYDFKIHKDV